MCVFGREFDRSGKSTSGSATEVTLGLNCFNSGVGVWLHVLHILVSNDRGDEREIICYVVAIARGR